MPLRNVRRIDSGSARPEDAGGGGVEEGVAAAKQARAAPGLDDLEQERRTIDARAQA